MVFLFTLCPKSMPCPRILNSPCSSCIAIVKELWRSCWLVCDPRTIQNVTFKSSNTMWEGLTEQATCIVRSSPTTYTYSTCLTYHHIWFKDSQQISLHAAESHVAHSNYFKTCFKTSTVLLILAVVPFLFCFRRDKGTFPDHLIKCRHKFASKRQLLNTNSTCLFLFFGPYYFWTHVNFPKLFPTVTIPSPPICLWLHFLLFPSSLALLFLSDAVLDCLELFPPGFPLPFYAFCIHFPNKTVRFHFFYCSYNSLQNKPKPEAAGLSTSTLRGSPINTNWIDFNKCVSDGRCPSFNGAKGNM